MCDPTKCPCGSEGVQGGREHIRLGDDIRDWRGCEGGPYSAAKLV